MIKFWDKIEDWIMGLFAKNISENAIVSVDAVQIPVTRLLSDKVGGYGIYVTGRDGYPRIDLWVDDKDNYTYKFSIVLRIKDETLCLLSYFYWHSRLRFYFKAVDYRPYHYRNELAVFDSRLDVKDMCELYSMKIMALRDIDSETRDKIVSLYNTQISRCLDLVDGKEPKQPNTLEEIIKILK